jgi:hypothetical protein
VQMPETVLTYEGRITVNVKLAAKPHEAQDKFRAIARCFNRPSDPDGIPFVLTDVTTDEYREIDSDNWMPG